VVSFEKVWETGNCKEEWLSNRLKLLPRKGDLNNFNNWKGIMLIEYPSKIYTLDPEGLK
jgi:hypothetical protein